MITIIKKMHDIYSTTCPRLDWVTYWLTSCRFTFLTWSRRNIFSPKLVVICTPVNQQQPKAASQQKQSEEARLYHNFSHILQTLIFSSFRNVEIAALEWHTTLSMSVNNLFFPHMVEARVFARSRTVWRCTCVCTLNIEWLSSFFQKPLQPDMGHNSLANFQIEKKIGRGQFSEVYRARYLLDNTSVALKKIQVRHLKYNFQYQVCSMKDATK